MKSSFRVLLFFAVMIQLGCSVSVTGPTADDAGGDVIPNSATRVVFSEPGAGFIDGTVGVTDGKISGLYQIHRRDGVFVFWGKLGEVVQKRQLCEKCSIAAPENLRSVRGMLRQGGVFYRLNGDKALHYFELGSARDLIVAEEGTKFFLNQNQVAALLSDDKIQFYDLLTNHKWTISPKFVGASSIYLQNLYFDQSTRQLKALARDRTEVFLGRTFQTFQLELQFKKVLNLTWGNLRTEFLEDGSAVFSERSDSALWFTRYNFLTEETSKYDFFCPESEGFEGATYKGEKVSFCRGVYRNMAGTVLREVNPNRPSWPLVIALNDQWTAFGLNDQREQTFLEVKTDSDEVIWKREEIKSDARYLPLPDAQYSTLSNLGDRSDLHLSDLVIVSTYDQRTRANAYKVVSLSTKRSVDLDQELTSYRYYALPKGRLLGWDSQKGELLWLNLSRELYAQ